MITAAGSSGFAFIQTMLDERRATCGALRAGTIISPRLISISSSRQIVTDCGAYAAGRSPSKVTMREMPWSDAAPAGEHKIAFAERTGSQLSGITPEIQIGPQHILHREACGQCLASNIGPDFTRDVQVTPGHERKGAGALLDHVIAIERADRNKERIRAPMRCMKLVNSMQMAS